MNVVVSMMAPEGKKVYHRQDCMYVKRMKPQNRMILPRKQAEEHGCRCCSYCGGLQGEMRQSGQIQAWKRDYQVSLDYVKKTDTLYVRTDMGCWKIFCERGGNRYLLWHRNTYDSSMLLEQAVRGAYHRQGDVKPAESLAKLIRYIADHDKAKRIIMDDYRKLPRATKRQKKYYRQAEKRARRWQQGTIGKRMEELFQEIEAKDPEMKKLAFC